MPLFHQHRPLCLASSSPRRQAFLKSYGLNFECYSPHIREHRCADEAAHTFVARMAKEKALDVQQHFPNSLILAGDTLAIFQEQVLGKPESPENALDMLRMLSGNEHEVCSAYQILDPVSGKSVHNRVCTKVRFRALSEACMQWYVYMAQESLDKAGGYSIQGIGAMLVQSILGSYNNVVGFPMEEILEDLLQEGWISYS